jgi:hypothetical protein
MPLKSTVTSPLNQSESILCYAKTKDATYQDWYKGHNTRETLHHVHTNHIAANMVYLIVFLYGTRASICLYEFCPIQWFPVTHSRLKHLGSLNAYQIALDFSRIHVCSVYRAVICQRLYMCPRLCLACPLCLHVLSRATDMCALSPQVSAPYTPATKPNPAV